MDRDTGLAEALRRIESLYSRSLAEHGIDSRSAGWPDSDSQLLRFRKLAHLIELDRPTSPVSVNDWGCGYGAMFGFLTSLDGVDLARYRGYDLSLDMLEAARAQFRDPRATFVHGSEIDEDADYTFVSGTFNVRMEADEESWSRHVRDALRMIAARSRTGFAFNLLTSYVDWRKDDLFYADPAEFFRFCKEELSRSVTLLHDYPLFEWTIVVLHDDRA